MNNQSNSCTLDHILFSAMSAKEQEAEEHNDKNADHGTTVRLNRIISN